ncbi:hypothetical protein GYMLUDRAFT_253098 [Collybiopsis luxurians FD-317 M1]|uniref:F-box domain-containing protein n=1 Tax=Collybiopsis luxurians FD-317 M1 TaxID=944289 RepID=A0A0D0BLN0_9AGAR|nr:hypothetical protein GYMLUDRAFT_253098 [Collybiopsis luxurians FD-317 M1]
MQLAQVSTLWRNIIINSPLFWCSFTVSAAQCHQDHPLLRLFLERSTNRPICFNIMNTEKVDVNLTYSAIFDHTDRWGCVGIYGRHGTARVRELVSRCISLPAITRLAIRTGNSSFPDAFPISSPHLRHLTVSNLVLEGNFPTVVTLTLAKLSAAWMRYILSTCPSAEKIIVCKAWELDLNPVSELELPNARELIVHSTNYISTGQLISALRTPNLLKLHIDMACYHSFEDTLMTEAISRMLQFNSSLTELSVSRLYFTKDQADLLIRAIPNVTKLFYADERVCIRSRIHTDTDYACRWLTSMTDPRFEADSEHGEQKGGSVLDRRMPRLQQLYFNIAECSMAALLRFLWSRTGLCITVIRKRSACSM